MRENKNRSSDESSPLYHYTTAEGLLGIISNQRRIVLRASRIQYLNDSSEYEYFERTLESYKISDMIEHASAERKKFWDVLRERFWILLQNPGGHPILLHPWPGQNPPPLRRRDW